MTSEETAGKLVSLSYPGSFQGPRCRQVVYTKEEASFLLC